MSHVDLAPTLSTWPGCAPRLRLAGREPRRGAASGDGAAAHPVAMEIAVAPKIPPVRQRAIRNGRHKLITSFDDQRVADALYDVESDPGELRNLVDGGARASPTGCVGRCASLVAERAETVDMAGDEDEEIAERLRELGYL